MDRVENEKVLKLLQMKLHFMKDMIKRKMRYAGNVLRDSSGLLHLIWFVSSTDIRRLCGRIEASGWTEKNMDE